VLRRVSWSAVAALTFIVLALVAAMLREQALTIAFGFGAVTWAILSLKEQT
jgi:hypothetical protein